MAVETINVTEKTYFILTNKQNEYIGYSEVDAQITYNSERVNLQEFTDYELFKNELLNNYNIDDTDITENNDL